MDWLKLIYVLMVLNLVDLGPQGTKYLRTFLVITTGFGGCAWHLVGKDSRNVSQYLTMHKRGPLPLDTAQNYPTQSINNA